MTSDPPAAQAFSPIVELSPSDLDRWGLRQSNLVVTSILYNAVDSILYVGLTSDDVFRRNLLAFVVNPEGTLGEPVVLPDHPKQLTATRPERQRSGIASMCLSPSRRKLFLGVDVAQPSPVPYGIVGYDLDRGIPLQNERSPKAYFSQKAPPDLGYGALALHNSGSPLYAISQHVNTVYAFHVKDEEPTGEYSTKPLTEGGVCLGITDRGKTLAVGGTDPSGTVPTLWTVALDPDTGNFKPGVSAASHELSEADNDSGRALISVGPMGIYFKTNSGRLGYSQPDAGGYKDFVYDPSSKHGRIRAVAGPLTVPGPGPGKVLEQLLVAADHEFKDAVDGSVRSDGVVLLRVPLDQLGHPVDPPETLGFKFRQQCKLLVAEPAGALFIAPLTGFLGNRISDLFISVSLEHPAMPEPPNPLGTRKIKAAKATLDIGSHRHFAQFNLEVGGPTTEPIRLDQFLQWGSGFEVARVQLNDLQWLDALAEPERTQAAEQSISPSDPTGCNLASFTAPPPVPDVVVVFAISVGAHGPQVKVARSHINGTQSVLLLPRFGVDDPNALASMIQTSVDHVRFYNGLATEGLRTAGLIAHPPERTRVNAFFVNEDANIEALEVLLDTLKLLGCNSASTNYPIPSADLPSKTIVDAIRLKVGDSALSVGDSGPYFTYTPPISMGTPLKHWICTNVLSPPGY